MVFDGAGSSRETDPGYGRGEVMSPAARLRQLEARFQGQVESLEQKLKGHDDLLARIVEALEYLQNAILEQEQMRAAAGGLRAGGYTGMAAGAAGNEDARR